jgi:hypothetical protein
VEFVSQHSGLIGTFIAAVIIPMGLCGAAMMMFSLNAGNEGRS